MKMHINPLLVSFDQENEKRTDLSTQVIALVHAHSQLILAYPQDVLPPETPFNHAFHDALVDKTTSMMSEGEIKGGELLTLEVGMEKGYRFFDLYFQTTLLNRLGVPDSDFQKLVMEMNRKEKRAIGIQKDFTSLLPFIRKPAPWLLSQYSVLVQKLLRDAKRT